MASIRRQMFSLLFIFFKRLSRRGRAQKNRLRLFWVFFFQNKSKHEGDFILEILFCWIRRWREKRSEGWSGKGVNLPMAWRRMNYEISSETRKKAETSQVLGDWFQFEFLFFWALSKLLDHIKERLTWVNAKLHNIHNWDGGEIAEGWQWISKHNSDVH